MPKLIYCQDVYSDAPPPVGRGTPNTPEGALIGDFLDNGNCLYIVMPGMSLWDTGSSVSTYIREIFEERDRLATILEDADKSINRVEQENKTLRMADKEQEKEINRLAAENSSLRENVESKIRDLTGFMERCVTPTMAPPPAVEDFVGWVERIGKVFR